MKNVLILGASGSLASYVIEALQAKSDVALTLFLRSKNRLHSRTSKKSRIVEGDVLDYPTLKEAMQGQDIVYVNLAGNLDAMAKKLSRPCRKLR